MFSWVRKLFAESGNKRSAPAAAPRPRSATAAVLAQRHRPAAAAKAPKPAPVVAKPAPAAARRSAPSTDFDPYNTGKFDRASSWERVRHSHR